MDEKNNNVIEVKERLVAIETLLKTIVAEHNPCKLKIQQMDREIAELKASTKSAHHRADNLQINISTTKNDIREDIKVLKADINTRISIAIAATGLIVGIVTNFAGRG